MTDHLTINSDASLATAITKLCQQYQEHHYLEIDVRVRERQRSDQQRKAIEVYCRELAKALNDAGLDQRSVLAAMSEGVEIPWRQESIKDVLWRRVQTAQTGKQSTTQLSRQEVGQIYEIVNRWTSDTFGVGVPWPEREKA